MKHGFNARCGEHHPWQTYEFQMHLRRLHQLALHDEAWEPDDFSDPEKRSGMDRRTLKDSLTVINDIKAAIKDMYHLSGAQRDKCRCRKAGRP